jgi:alkyl hydroperoxide reductase subunit AhpF
MSLISSEDQQALRDAFSTMTRSIRLLFFTQTVGCDTCLQTRQILDELPLLSDKIIIDEVNLILDVDRVKQYAVERVPAIAIAYEDDKDDGAVTDSRIRFIGTPAGYEFISLIQAILLVGGGRESTLTADNRARVEAVEEPVTIQVFSTPS